jgi:hypothetical protein
MPRDIVRFRVVAINQHGKEVLMKIVERSNRLWFWYGLDQVPLVAPPDCNMADLQLEVKQLAGLSRLVVTPP